MKTLLAAMLALLFLQAPKATLEGIVTTLDTRQPVAGARLTLRPVSAPRNAPAPTALTNIQGQFTFTGLDEGAYVIQAEANGHVPQPSAAQVGLTAGQTTRDVVIRLTPAATISGRLRDSQGRPIVNLPVQLIRSGYSYDGRPLFSSLGTVRTDDRGEYRIYWVAPGRYYLLAGTPFTVDDPVSGPMQQLIAGAGGPSGTPLPRIVGHAYYPGVADPATARLLDLAPGADLQGVDLTINTNPPTFRVTGRLIDSTTGQPPPRASVALTPTQPINAVGNNPGLLADFPNRNYNPATGAFELRGALTGTYFVTATAGSPQQATGTGAVAVTVSDKDVEGVMLSIHPGGALTGRLRVEGELPAGMPMNCVRIILTPRTSGDAPPSELRQAFAQCKQVALDGTFTIPNVPAGDYAIAIYGFPAGSNNFQATLTGHGFVKEALFRGVDALNNPLRVASDGNNGSLDIVIAMGGGRIDGTVIDATLRPLPARRVVLVPETARFQWQLYRMATTNENGQFSLAAVAPGSYRLYAWETMEEFAWFGSELLKRYEALARPLRVTETSSETIDLRIIPAAEGAR